MTLDELLVRCRNAFDVEDCVEARRELIIVAKDVINTLGESLPCGVETPGVNWTMVIVPAFSGEPSEARAYAAAILRAADSVDGGAQ